MSISNQDRLLFLTIIALLLTISVGCSGPERLPTLVPTAAARGNSGTPTTLNQQTNDTPGKPINGPLILGSPSLAPPTLGPSTSEPTSPQPTETQTPTPVVSTREPTALPPSGVNITSPVEGTVVQLGQQIEVSGRSRLAATQTITVSLVSLSGRILDARPARIDDLSNWRVTMETPQNITGPARIEAIVFDENGQPVSSDSEIVELLLGDEPGDRYLTLSRPRKGDIGVNGFNLLFDGHAQRPVNNLVTVSLWIDSCQQQAASQSFRLNGSGAWWGLLFVPNSFQGEACAVAHFGSPGDQDWREAQTLIEVVPGDYISADAIVIARPRNSSSVPRGQTLEIKGLAYNAPERLVNVTVMLDNGRILNEGVTAADQHGFWELSLFIPGEAGGSAQIIVSTGLEGTENYRQSTTSIFIE
jgi:hypothetical protein